MWPGRPGSKWQILVTCWRRNLWIFVELSTPIGPISGHPAAPPLRSLFVSMTLSASIFRSDYGIASAIGLFEHTRHEKPTALYALGGIAMRSKLIFGAMTQVSNRFLLVKLASTA